eukprot:CAMPEP_0181217418 /NCGR_PEP_ID=MMETSP1096-20121128/27139_1 /TAXON_ID=156174 ORGANISM="Chrysochromulina ericina, Strain CCMP281" /NCGR_SAMPLE_ID=MMETSP1096 /ASSEMBLY_ACC=CAM_ASM_000453 /LENGTH=242 /DNA_ID=CAMNT_0023309545 /DNA_START=164 /DNA_END=890 /DNA_ORIENTATION=-
MRREGWVDDHITGARWRRDNPGATSDSVDVRKREAWLVERASEHVEAAALVLGPVAFRELHDDTDDAAVRLRIQRIVHHRFDEVTNARTSEGFCQVPILLRSMLAPSWDLGRKVGEHVTVTVVETTALAYTAMNTSSSDGVSTIGHPRLFTAACAKLSKRSVISWSTGSAVRGVLIGQAAKTCDFRWQSEKCPVFRMILPVAHVGCLPLCVWLPQPSSHVIDMLWLDAGQDASDLFVPAWVG